MLPSSLRSLEHGALPLERNAELAAPQMEARLKRRAKDRGRVPSPTPIAQSDEPACEPCRRAAHTSPSFVLGLPDFLG
jgi:hypothetical protein